MIYIPVSPSELADRVSLLEIEVEESQDKEERKHRNKRLDPLLTIFQDEFPWEHAVKKPMTELRKVNRKLHDVHDAIEMYIKSEDFGETFVHLVSSIPSLEAKKKKILQDIEEVYCTR